MQLSEQTKKIQSFIQKHPDISKLNEKDVSEFYPIILNKGDVEVISSFWHLFYIELIDCLIDHNHQYYIENTPIISDKEYDELFDYLKKIEEHFPQLITSNSPTQGLIGQVSEGFKKAKHEYPMLSLENTYNAQDIKERDERVRKILEKANYGRQIYYLIEPKYDGISIELVYENGKLIKAITRGDGKIGEDVTENVKTIKNIRNVKVSFPGKIYFRGEIVLPKSELLRINQEREEDGLSLYTNTRNLAAGSIKQLDSKVTAERNLQCYIYELKIDGKFADEMILLPEDKRPISINDLINIEVNPIEYILKCGFEYKKIQGRIFTKIDEVVNFCEDPETKGWLNEKFSDIDFDGLVIKVDEEAENEIKLEQFKNNVREVIGTTDHHPRRAVAYKFPAQLATTQILSVDFQVGRTGIITPVANFNPVQLSGATLKRVSLHNFDFIKEKDIHLHDWIRLQRSGEVIPYIVSVITDRREKLENGKLKIENCILPPKNCPSCHQAIVQKDIHYYCTNPYCPEKTKQQIQYFVSKNCMDIQGIGESIIDILVENKIIENVADIYKLTDQNTQITLRKFPGIGNRKIAEIVKGIEESKHKALWRLLNGLGIPHVGKKTAQDIAAQMNDEGGMINNLTNNEWLGSIYGIGEKSIETISIFFSNTKNLAIFQQLKHYGVNMDPKKYNDLINMSDAKGAFSITGSFDLPREKIADIFKQQGYIFHESPTKTTDFMLIGDKAGSKKIKAEELGIKMYEGREIITQHFPFLKNIQTISNKPKTQSLFL